MSAPSPPLHDEDYTHYNCCHCRCKQDKHHNANIIHMPDIHFTAGWMGGTYKQMTNVELELQPLDY